MLYRTVTTGRTPGFIALVSIFILFKMLVEFSPLLFYIHKVIFCTSMKITGSNSYLEHGGVSKGLSPPVKAGKVAI